MHKRALAGAGGSRRGTGWASGGQGAWGPLEPPYGPGLDGRGKGIG